MTTSETEAMIEGYADGDCLLLAFALHWMCGWPVMAVSEQGSDMHLHFAAVGPDDLAWDSLGPRSLEASGASHAETPVWEEVDAYRFITTDPKADEDSITQACRDARIIFGARLEPHVRRQPCRSET